jgi:hypothetical protein
MFVIAEIHCGLHIGQVVIVPFVVGTYANYLRDLLAVPAPVGKHILVLLIQRNIQHSKRIFILS